MISWSGADKLFPQRKQHRLPIRWPPLNCAAESVVENRRHRGSSSSNSTWAAPFPSPFFAATAAGWVITAVVDRDVLDVLPFKDKTAPRPLRQKTEERLLYPSFSFLFVVSTSTKAQTTQHKIFVHYIASRFVLWLPPFSLLLLFLANLPAISRCPDSLFAQRRMSSVHEMLLFTPI